MRASILIPLVAVLTIGGNTMAEGPAASPAEKLDSKLTEYLNPVATLAVETQVERMKSLFPNDVEKKKLFSDEKQKSLIKDYINFLRPIYSRTFTAEEVDYLIRLNNSPLGAKLRKLEVEMTRVAEVSPLNRFGREIFSQPKDIKK
jgi:hypothetical protein